MICGDLNARTSSATCISGNEENIMENLENGEFLISRNVQVQCTPYSKRSRMDAVFNSRGRKLIDAASQNLKILNGAMKVPLPVRLITNLAWLTTS